MAESQQEITVLDGNTGAPVAGAEVTLYQYEYGTRGRTVEGKRTTDAERAGRSIRPTREADTAPSADPARAHGCLREGRAPASLGGLDHLPAQWGAVPRVPAA